MIMGEVLADPQILIVDELVSFMMPSKNIPRIITFFISHSLKLHLILCL